MAAGCGQQDSVQATTRRYGLVTSQVTNNKCMGWVVFHIKVKSETRLNEQSGSYCILLELPEAMSHCVEDVYTQTSSSQTCN